eukprot:TRINITY_DN12180_c0_g2_i1.p2 TRINITY_DN12180_c0_g2~~TRINITY_DN12180_c0_g2_i1.p2  ORF type:complete len:480 (+),score=155.98 TRINITY_DN12180_c0_g2_i1:78-1442(+)
MRDSAAARRAVVAAAAFFAGLGGALLVLTHTDDGTESPAAGRERRLREAFAAAGSRYMPSETRFLSFEPWNGGWNNRRMSLELAFVLCVLLNRTLVLPPVSNVAMLTDKTGYEDFFSLSTMRSFVPVLTWAEFAPLVPHLQPSPGASPDPLPCNYRMRNPRAFCQQAAALRRKARVVPWDWLRLVITWPELRPSGAEEEADLYAFSGMTDVRVNHAVQMSELRGESIVHFPQTLFGLWYMLFYVPRASERRRLARVVRDGLRLQEPLLELGRKLAAALGGRGNFSCMHIRRRDFRTQFHYAWVEVDKIGANVRALFPGGGHKVYVATDEPGTAAEFWAKVHKALPEQQVLTPAAAVPVLEKAPPYWRGVAEQIACSQAEVFVGTRYSTFSAYITRLRGYDPFTTNKEVYFTDTPYTERGEAAQRDRPYGWSGKWRIAPWGREYPEAWEGIDEAG